MKVDLIYIISNFKNPLVSEVIQLESDSYPAVRNNDRQNIY